MPEAQSTVTDLSLYAAGIAAITELHDLPRMRSLRSLNLHCNELTSITHIDHLLQLTYINLSSNRIEAMSGLQHLTELRTLDLSCNRISLIDGLSTLQQLQRLLLSYNRIGSLAGLIQAHSGALTHFEAYGNQIGLLREAEYFTGLPALRTVVLSRHGATNPVCELPTYRDAMTTLIPQLCTLDDVATGATNRASTNATNGVTAGGARSYLDPPPAPHQPLRLAPTQTPHIDRAMGTLRAERRAVGVSGKQELLATLRHELRLERIESTLGIHDLAAACASAAPLPLNVTTSSQPGRQERGQREGGQQPRPDATAHDCAQGHVPRARRELRLDGVGAAPRMRMGDEDGSVLCKAGLVSTSGAGAASHDFRGVNERCCNSRGCAKRGGKLGERCEWRGAASSGRCGDGDCDGADGEEREEEKEEEEKEEEGEGDVDCDVDGSDESQYLDSNRSESASSVAEVTPSH